MHDIMGIVLCGHERAGRRLVRQAEGSGKEQGKEEGREGREDTLSAAEQLSSARRHARAWQEKEGERVDRQVRRAV